MRGPPVLPPGVWGFLLVVHRLHSIAVGDNSGGRFGELVPHHAVEAALVEASLVDPSLPSDGHAILGEGKAVHAGGDMSVDMYLHLGVVDAIVVVVGNDDGIPHFEGVELSLIHI